MKMEFHCQSRALSKEVELLCQLVPHVICGTVAQAMRKDLAWKFIKEVTEDGPGCNCIYFLLCPIVHLFIAHDSWRSLGVLLLHWFLPKSGLSHLKSSLQE